MCYHPLSFQIRLRPQARQSPHLSHLQLISALGAVYLYLPAIICSLPDCLVCFAKLSRDLYVNHKPDYPVFRPWTVPRIPFSLPAPRLTCLPVLSDLPVLTLPACPPDYSACFPVVLVKHRADVQGLTLLWYNKVKERKTTFCVYRAFGFLFCLYLKTLQSIRFPHVKPLLKAVI